MPLKAEESIGTKCGVCVLTYNSSRVIADCLRALLRVHDPPCRIVVVDNVSSDGTVDLVAAEFPSVDFIRNPSNSGYAQGNNVGAEFLLQDEKLEFLAFVNPDVAVFPETLKNLTGAILAQPEAACAGGVAVVSGSAWPEAFRNRPTLAQKLIISGKLRYLPIIGSMLSGPVERMKKAHFISLDSVSSGTPIGIFSGACFLIKASVFKQIGGFDPRTFLFQEEFILSERLRSAGYKVVAAPDALYAHLGGHSVKRRPVRASWSFVRSEQILLRDYYKRSSVTCLAVLLYRVLEQVLGAGFAVVMLPARWLRSKLGRATAKAHTSD